MLFTKRLSLWNPRANDPFVIPMNKSVILSRCSENEGGAATKQSG